MFTTNLVNLYNRNIFKTSLYIFIFQDEKCRLCAIYLYLWSFLLIGKNGVCVSINYLPLFLMKLESVFSSDIPFVEWRVWFTPVPSKPFLHAVLYIRNINVYFPEDAENVCLHSNFLTPCWRNSFVYLTSVELSSHSRLAYTLVWRQFKHRFRDKHTEFSTLDD